MARMKDLAMDYEEQFEDKMAEIIGGCESFFEFESAMESHMDLVKHVDMDEIRERMADAWGEFWSDKAEENRG